MELLIIVHIKSSYDNWKAVFDADHGNGSVGKNEKRDLPANRSQ